MCACICVYMCVCPARTCRPSDFINLFSVDKDLCPVCVHLDLDIGPHGSGHRLGSYQIFHSPCVAWKVFYHAFYFFYKHEAIVKSTMGVVCGAECIKPVKKVCLKPSKTHKLGLEIYVNTTTYVVWRRVSKPIKKSLQRN